MVSLVLQAAQDAVILVERLLGWTDAELEKDLEAYDDASAADAREARDRLLNWIKMDAAESLEE